MRLLDTVERSVPAAAIFLLLCAAGAGLAWWGRSALADARSHFRAAMQNQQGSAAELRQLQAGLPHIKQDIADYDVAAQKGGWAAEDRRRFSEDLTQLAQALRLQKLEYSVAPQEAYAANGSAGHWMRSPLEVQLGLQHEGQLLSFAEAFPTLPGGLPVLHSCRIARPQNGDGKGNLLAECKGSLYSAAAPDRTAP
ncbi:MAG: hypothetical protein EPO06_04415 [Burkholderiaceae bacterium]|nr:MAG: hypothetical protein EPO06_04415 [Burkholderiaceae bacterium]